MNFPKNFILKTQSLGKTLSLSFFLICIAIVIPVYSIDPFPISIQEGWKVAPKKTLDPINSVSWKEIPKITYRVDPEKDQLNSEIVEYTFYKEFHLTEQEIRELREDISLFIPFLANVYEIYLNGEKIGGRGKITDGKILENGTMINLVQILPLNLLKPGTNEIRIILGGYRNEEIALYGDKDTEINYYRKHRERHSDTIDFVLIGIYIIVGMYHLLLGIKRPQDGHNLYFGILSILIGIYFYTRTIHINMIGLEYLIQFKLELISLFFTAIFLLFFFQKLLINQINKIGKFYLYFIFLETFVVLISGRVIMMKALLLFQASALFMLIYISYLMINGIRQKNNDVRSLLIGFIIMMMAIAIDLVGAMHVIEGFENPSFTRFGFFCFVMGIAFVLANRFLRLHKEVEELNSNLEKKVQIRTIELRESLDNIQKLKTQQDGDYFLTTLLIKPLMLNESVSDRVKVEFFIKQKKNFEFRNKHYEIGGDICISNNIELKGRKYISFVNADAMGKSIQGAGGALVLGVVFRSIITRTNSVANDKYPEQWLKICFIELQNVFVSFNGSMLVSAVIGLVDESNGTFFFINAEHPWTVLYRDGKASFLETSMSLRKIGMTGLDGSLKVGIFKMLPGDALIVGSDGRDDILLSTNSFGERQINEDETLFLRSVEYAKGDLQKIAQCSIEIGELTDDYTLIKISYFPESGHELDSLNEERFYELTALANQLFKSRKYLQSSEVLEQAWELKQNDREVLKKLIHLLFNLKLFDKTVYYCKKYLELEPIDSEHLFILASSCKLANNLSEAIDAGESLRLRDPYNVKNLINLSDAYRLYKNMERANKILLLALELEPENEKAIKLRSILESH
jgi:hypothetical protein